MYTQIIVPLVFLRERETHTHGRILLLTQQCGGERGVGSSSNTFKLIVNIPLNYYVKDVPQRGLNVVQGV